MIFRVRTSGGGARKEGNGRRPQQPRQRPAGQDTRVEVPMGVLAAIRELEA